MDTQEKETPQSLADSEKEREASYDRYLESQKEEAEKAAVPPAEEKKEEMNISEKSPQSTETKKEEYVAAAKTEDIIPSDKKIDTAAAPQKEKEEKFVPYDALHEEREKRKSAQKRARELEDKVNYLLREIEAQKQAAKPIQKTEEEQSVFHDDPLIKSLKEELAYLKNQLFIREQQEKEAYVKSSMNNLQNDIRNVDESLEKEGYPAFGIMVNRVTDELKRLVEEDPDNQYLDNPNGWKKIYKEIVFPQIKNKFVPISQKQNQASKEALKSAAQLAGSGGRVETQEEKSDDWTYEDYSAERKKKQLY